MTVAIKLFFYFSLLAFADNRAETSKALWEISEALYPTSSHVIEAYKRNLKPGSPTINLISNPENLKLAKKRIQELWTTELEKEFSEQEVKLILKIAESKVYQKNIRFEEKFWVQNNINLEIEKTLLKHK